MRLLVLALLLLPAAVSAEPPSCSTIYIPCLRCDVCEGLAEQAREAEFELWTREFKALTHDREARRLLEEDTPAEAYARQRARHLPPGTRLWGSP